MSFVDFSPRRYEDLSPINIEIFSPEISAAKVLHYSQAKHSLPVRTVESLTKLVKEIFNELAQFLNKIRDFIINLVTSPKVIKKTEELGPVTKTVDVFLARLGPQGESKPSSIVKKEPEQEIVVSEPIKALAAAYNYAVMPFHMMQLGGGGNIASAIIAASHYHHDVDSKGMKTNLDTVDRCLYAGGVYFAAQALNRITLEMMPAQIQAFAAIISTTPLLQQKVSQYPIFQDISEIVHEAMKDARQAAIDGLEPHVKSFLANQSRTVVAPMLRKSIVPFVNHYEGQMDKALVTAENNNLGFSPSRWILKGRVGSIIQSKLDQAIAVPAEKCFNDSLNQAARKVSTMIVDYSVLGVKTGVVLVASQRALGTTFAEHPVLTSVSMIAAGGPQQSLSELAVRVTAVAVLAYTGNTTLALAVIYTPKVIDGVNNAIDYWYSLAGIEGVKDRKWYQQPAADAITDKVKAAYKKVSAYMPNRKVLQFKPAEEVDAHGKPIQPEPVKNAGLPPPRTVRDLPFGRMFAPLLRPIFGMFNY